MSRPAPLNTAVQRHQRVYSYMETPIELQNPASLGGRQHPSMPIVYDAPEPPVRREQFAALPGQDPALHQQHPAHFAPYADSSNVQRQLPSQGQQTYQSTQSQYQSPQSQCQSPQSQLQSPQSQSQLTQQSQLGPPQVPETPQPPYQSPPHSPGPLPVKNNFEAPEIQQPPVVPIAPDTNPLHPPRTPTFARTGTGGIESNDLYMAHLPGQISHPNQEIIGGTWTTGLCECSDLGTCCLGIWCPCILYGKTQFRLSRRSRQRDPTNLLGYETCNASCTLMAILCGCQWLLATIQHTRTRKAYKIQGDCPSDCVRATCCTCCTLIQDEREIKRREEARADTARTFGANLSSPYILQEQMRYGPTR